MTLSSFIGNNKSTFVLCHWIQQPTLQHLEKTLETDSFVHMPTSQLQPRAFAPNLVASLIWYHMTKTSKQMGVNPEMLPALMYFLDRIISLSMLKREKTSNNHQLHLPMIVPTLSLKIILIPWKTYKR